VLFLSFISFVVSFIAVRFVRRWFRRHAQNYVHDAPQRFHHGAIPRLGGLGMVVGWLAGMALAFFAPYWGMRLGVPMNHADFVGLSLVVLSAVLVGSAEDVTQRVAVRWRLLATGLIGLMAVLLLDVSVPRLGLAWLDPSWSTWPMLGMALAILAIMGLPHAFNIIDGYNGLAGSVTVLIGLALTYVSLQVGDRQLAALCLCLIATTLGFLFWNYPRGLIFAGDGGAYMWGVSIALICILLVQRHGSVSPWFPMLLLIYPVWETVFSIYRKWSRGMSPSLADALHLHQLVYRRLVRVVFDEDEARSLLLRNNRTSPYLMAFSLMSVTPALFFWSNTPVLIGFCVLFIFTYVGAYLMIVRFKIPDWLKLWHE
jgi:UDP-N-acetylmuramyl pentapeptide phosphotransferase/UDP-N-acetylglucosamine-1-phosphate transferase